MKTEIQQVNPVGPHDLARVGTPGVLDILQEIIRNPAIHDAAATAKELVALHEHMEATDAKKQWAAAFERVSAKLPTIVATRIVPGKEQGSVRWRYAGLEDILDAIEPVLRDEGLSLRFDSAREANNLTVFLHVIHRAGHEEISRCTVNVANAMGGDLGALKQAKRGALLEMFALKVRDDQDARRLGELIDPDEQESLQAKVKAAGMTDLTKFFTFAQAKDFAGIRDAKLPELHKFLDKKIAQRNTPPAPIGPDEAKRIADREANESRQ